MMTKKRPNNRMDFNSNMNETVNANRIAMLDERTGQVAGELNLLLANYQIYYQNLRGLHWNISGPSFFTLHEKFEELYTSAASNIDMLAERILTLNATPLHTFQDYLDHAKLDVAKGITDDRRAVETVLNNQTFLINHLRNIIDFSDEFNDEGTNDMAVELLRKLEKHTWMMAAYLKETPLAK